MTTESIETQISILEKRIEDHKWMMYCKEQSYSRYFNGLKQHHDEELRIMNNDLKELKNKLKEY